MKRNKTALVAAVDLLALRSHSVKELREKLCRKGYEEDEVATAVEALTKRGYLNDQELCAWTYRRYLEEARHSLRQMECKLLQKGFSQACIRACRGDGDQAAEKMAADKVLRSRYTSPDKAPPLRMMQYLYGKGFGGDAIKEAVKDFTKQDATIFCDETIE